MLIIRPEQMETLQSAVDARFVDDFIQYLMQEHAEVEIRLPTGTVLVNEIPAETLRVLLHNGIARARRYSISWEPTLRAFLVLMFVMAPNFDEQVTIQSFLEDEEVPDEFRIERLWDGTDENDWEEVERNYDPGAWQQDERTVHSSSHH